MSNHEHGTGLHGDLATRYSQATWDARYSESTRVWSGNPNTRLVEYAADLPAGDALDVGAGEGADAVWLAKQGWNVTALDVSPVALGKVAAHADEAGVGDRVNTVQHDLLGEPAVPGTYDLVSAHFWHPPTGRFAETFQGMGAAVRAGGYLLIVGHHPGDVANGARDAHGHAELLFTPEQVVAVLPAEEWEIKAADALDRTQIFEGKAMDVTDSVVLAQRR